MCCSSVVPRSPPARDSFAHSRAVESVLCGVSQPAAQDDVIIMGATSQVGEMTSTLTARVALGFRTLGVVPADHELSCAWEAKSHAIVTTCSDGIITIMPTASQSAYCFT